MSKHTDNRQYNRQADLHSEPFWEQKLAYSIEEFTFISGIGRSAIYEEIRKGRLTARKVGARTVILKEDGLKFLRSLPVKSA